MNGNVGSLRVLVLADARAFHTERYVDELRRQGCQVLLASLESGRITHFPLKRRLFLRQLWYVLAAAEVRAVVNRFEPHIINPHFASGYGFTAALAQPDRSIPILLHLWGSDILIVPKKSVLHRRKTRHALLRADAVTGDSDYLMNAAQSLAPLRQSATIPWGIEERYLACHRTDYTLQHPLRVIVPRHHERIYNNVFILEALAPLIREGRITMTLPAFGSLTGDFRDRAEALDREAVHLYDKLPREQFLQLMARHDVYLSAALSDSSPASLIEAMGLGLIPVAADIPGVREWLSQGNGYRFEPGNAEQLLEIIGGIAGGADNHVEMRHRNLHLVKERALFEANIAQVVGIMRKLAMESLR